MFVACGNLGLRMASPDGKEWEIVEKQPDKTGGGNRIILYDCCFADGRFVTTGSHSYTGGNDSITSASETGLDWIDSEPLKDVGGHYYAVTYGNDFFLAMGGNGGHAGMTMGKSKDGVDWHRFDEILLENLPEQYRGEKMSSKYNKYDFRKLSKEAKKALEEKVDFDQARGHIKQLAFGNGRFVAIGMQQRNSVSEDGQALKWKTRKKDDELPPPMISLCFGNGLFVAGGMHGLRVWSEDGWDWSEPIEGEIGQHVNSLVWTGESFIGVANYATFGSRDGKEWETVKTDNLIRRVSYGNGRFVGTNGPGDRLYWSDDAITWQEASTPEDSFNVRVTCYGQV